MTWTRDWAHNTDGTPWHLDDIFGTVTYAARRILALLPPHPDGSPLDSTHARMTAAVHAKMKAAVHALDSTHDTYRTRRERGELQTMKILEENLQDIQRVSFQVASQGRTVLNPQLEHEWIEVFKMHQNIIQVALLQVGDNIMEAYGLS